MKKVLSVVVALLVCLVTYAQQVELVKVQASKMTKEVENNVIKPADYSEAVDYPVLYLLHGYGGNHNDWVNSNARWKMACMWLLPKTQAGNLS